MSPFRVSLVSRVLHDPIRFVLKARNGGYDLMEHRSMMQVHVLAQKPKRNRNSGVASFVEELEAREKCYKEEEEKKNKRRKSEEKKEEKQEEKEEEKQEEKKEEKPKEKQEEKENNEDEKDK